MADYRLALARQHHSAADYVRAEQLCRQIVQDDPWDLQAWGLLGEACMFQGKLGETVEGYQQALRLGSNSAEFHNNLGVALARQGRLDEAVRNFLRAMQLNPGYVSVYNNLAVALIEQGKPGEAVAYLRQAMSLHPDYADALYNLGNALQKQGKLDEAADSYRRALELKPDYADGHNNLAVALMNQGKTEEAITSCRRAIELKPDYAHSHNNLGTALKEPGKLDEAVACYRRAIELKPNYADAHNNLAVALNKQGKLDEAVACCQRAIGLKPNYAEAHNNLALVLAAQGKLDDAVASYQRALELKPNYAEAHTNLGNALAAQGKLDDAVASRRRAIELKPDFSDGHNNLAVDLINQGNLDEAMASCRRAIELKPDNAEAHNNLAVALNKQGKLDEAIPSYQRALELKPDYPEYHINLAMTLLLKGDYERGLAEYEWRCKHKATPRPPFQQPLWDGAPLAGRAILLHTEQGLGDCLQFIRYAPLVKQRGGAVVVACPKPLLRLLASCAGIDMLVAQAEPLPPFDVYTSLLSLPHILGTTPATVPAEVPYLYAQSDLVEYWRKELRSVEGFRIGIAWQGSSAYRYDRHRSFSLAHFESLARLPGVRLISLQKGPGIEELSALGERLPVVDLGGRFDETTGPFLDSAAIMKNLDLVISCDSVIAHLAGALAVPVWVALPFAPDWRWMLGREDSPWYPNHRLFRQTEFGNWTGVFTRMAEALEQRLAATPRSGPIAVPIGPGELEDKISILQIKNERMTDADKLANVRHELAQLIAARGRSVPRSETLMRLTAELKAINEMLWQVEEELRLCERVQDFGEHFIELARSVYRYNDERACLKRRINELLGSQLVEEKQYADAAG